MNETKQLEFNFTWFKFCELIDKENGAVVGGAVLECETDFKYWYIIPEEEEDFELTPYMPVLKDWQYS